MPELPRVTFVTGTGTGVGKTVATAAIVARLMATGRRTEVVKPTQTGLQPGEPGDLADVQRLAGDVPVHELVRLPDPLAPDAAARIAGVAIPSVAAHAEWLSGRAHRDDLDTVLVEGAGGLLVRLDARGGTLADLAVALQDAGVRVGVVVVAQAGLGTLNHVALTTEALARRALGCLGVVIGSWPDRPDLAMRCNLDDLPSVAGAPLLGRVPAGAGDWAQDRFAAQAPGWLAL